MSKNTSSKKKSKTTSKTKDNDLNYEIVDTTENNNDIIPISDYRKIIANYNPKLNKSKPILTDYEYTLIIGKRTTQISNHAEPLIDINPNMTPYDIAVQEVLQRKIPFMIKRKFGNKTEYWKIEDLQVNN